VFLTKFFPLGKTIAS
jgi:hypothetical protein